MQRLKGYTGVVRSKKLRSFKGRIETMKLQSLRVNMIPGTGLYSRPIEDTDMEQPARDMNTKDKKRDTRVDTGNILIDIHGTVFAGTILQIGNRTLTIEQTTAKRRFKLDESKTHIYAMQLH